MRTNIDIDDGLMAAAQEATGLPTKRAVVEEGLRILVRLREQQGIRALRGRIAFVEAPTEEDGAERPVRDASTKRHAAVRDQPREGEGGAKRNVRGRLPDTKGRARRAEGGAATGGEGDRRRR